MDFKYNFNIFRNDFDYIFIVIRTLVMVKVPEEILPVPLILVEIQEFECLKAAINNSSYCMSQGSH